MNDTELDDVYTALCVSLAAAGEPRAPQFLARFALLAMVELDDAARIRALIDKAARGWPSVENPPDQGGERTAEKITDQ